MQFSRPVHADGQGHFDVRCARGAGDQDCRRVTLNFSCVENLGKGFFDIGRVQDSDMDFWQQGCAQRLPLTAWKDQRARFCDAG